MKIITGIWKVKPKETNTFLDLCKVAKECATNENGCISFGYSEFKDQEDTYLFFEEWKDQNAIDFHITQWYFIDFMEKSKPLLTSDPIIKVYNVESFVNL